MSHGSQHRTPCQPRALHPKTCTLTVLPPLPKGLPAQAGMLRVGTGAERDEHPAPPCSTPSPAAPHSALRGHREHPAPCSTPEHPVPAAPQGAPQPPGPGAPPRRSHRCCCRRRGGTRGPATASGLVSGASPHSNRGRTSRKLHHGGPAPPAGTGGSPHRGEPAPALGGSASRTERTGAPIPGIPVSHSRGTRFPVPGVPVCYPGPVLPRTSRGRVFPPVLPVPPAEGPSRGHRPLLTRRRSGLSRTPPWDRRYRLLRGIIKRIYNRSRGPNPAGSARSPTGSALKGLRGGGASARFLSVRQQRFRFPFLSLLDECIRLQKVQPRAKKTNRRNPPLSSECAPRVFAMGSVQGGSIHTLGYKSPHPGAQGRATT